MYTLYLFHSMCETFTWESPISITKNWKMTYYGSYLYVHMTNPLLFLLHNTLECDLLLKTARQPNNLHLVSNYRNLRVGWQIDKNHIANPSTNQTTILTQHDYMFGEQNHEKWQSENNRLRIEVGSQQQTVDTMSFFTDVVEIVTKICDLMKKTKNRACPMDCRIAP